MGELLTRKTFAERSGVSPPYINKALKRGEVYRDPTTSKYPDDHPLNLAFMAKVRQVATPEPAEKIDDEELLQLQREKIKAQREKEEALARWYEIRNAEALRELIPMEVFRETFGDINSNIRTYILPIAERVALGDKDLRERIEAEVQTGLERFKQSMKVSIRRAQDAYNAETRRMQGGSEDDD